MAWSRVKNLLIAMLVAVNVFLLVMYGFISWRENRDLEQVSDDLIATADSLGIVLPREVVQSETQTLYPVQVHTDLAQDRAIAEELLGVCEETVREDGSVVYVGEKGNVCFYADNTLELELVLSESVEDERTAKKLAQTVVSKLGQVGGEPIFEEAYPGVDFLLTLPVTVSGMPVFQAQLTFAFERDFVVVSGRRVLHHPQQLRIDEMQELPGALLSLFGYWEERDLLEQTITDVDLGYLMEHQTGEYLTLLPVWHVAVQGGDWYVSALDGSILIP